MLGAHRHRLSTSTLQKVLAILRRAIRWGQARDMVSRNVAELVTAPTGAGGRPSKAMTLEQARAVLSACDRHPLGAYVTLALLVGVRNEELRAVTWDHVDLDGNPGAVPPVPPSIRVWRSVRAGGDTKTRLSRRTIGLPAQCVEILEKHRAQMAGQGLDVEHGLVFCTSTGTALDSANVRRSFRALCKEAGLDSERMDSPRNAALLRLLDERGRRPARSHRAGGRAQQHEGDRARLPQAAAAGAHRGNRRHGDAVRAARASTESGHRMRISRLISRLRDEEAPRAMWLRGFIVSLTCGDVLVGDTGFEPVTSSVSRKRATAAPIALAIEFEVGTGFEPV